ncbi:MAG: RNA-binding protein [Bauldia sp.]|nr:RNA-binding protein [Bauldia sp.]
MPRRNEPTVRTCIVTRAARPVDELIRFVAAPDGTVVPDIRRRLPGRGVWVTATAAMVETAERKRIFEKQFEGKVTVPPGLAARVDGLLLAAATGALALARKAGELIGGFAKVEAALAREPVVALVHAAGAGADGVAKLSAAARRRFGEGKLPVIRCFAAEHLDLAFGRTNVIHAALLAGPASDNVLARVGNLVGFRGDDVRPDDAGSGSFDAPIEMNDLSAGQ